MENLLKKRLFLIISLIFVVINLFLIAKDDGKKVSRVSYIPKWTTVVEKDMFETMEKSGVIDYAEKEDVYFHNGDGIFEQFFVSTGDAVRAGDYLFSYVPEQYEATKGRLEREVERLEDEIKVLEDAIKKMNQFSPERSRLQMTIPRDDDVIEIEQESDGPTFQKEQYIIEKEKELDRTKAQLDSVKSQLDDVTENDGVIYVESPVDGTVTYVSPQLMNPIVTVETDELHVISELTEQERFLVETEMDANIRVIENDEFEPFEGRVSFVSDEPTELSLTKESTYLFHVAFNDENEFDDLLRGYHVDLNIVLDESLNASVVPKEVVTKSSVWKMSNSGFIYKTDIEKGIEVDNDVELIEGVQVGDMIAFHSRNKLIDEASFITPLKPSKSSWKTMFKDGARKRSIVIALLAR